MSGLIGPKARELPTSFETVNGEGVAEAELAAERARRQWEALTPEQRAAEIAAHEAALAREEKLAQTRIRLAALQLPAEALVPVVDPNFDGVARKFYTEAEIISWAQQGVDIEAVLRPYALLGLPEELMRKVVDTAAEQVAEKARTAAKVERRTGAPPPPPVPDMGEMLKNSLSPKIAAIFDKAERPASTPLYTRSGRG